MKKSIIVTLAMLATLGVAHAQQLKVATGSASGTYSRMFKELSTQCSQTGLTLVEQNTSGSVENINLLTGNQVNAALVQTDVLFFRARNEDLGNVKTLLAFHPEEVHFVALANKKVGGRLGFGGNPLVSVEQLEGLKVGAAGGSYVTAQVIRLQSEIAFTVVQFDTGDNVLAALNSGDVDVAVFVGGAPLGNIQALGASHRLLTFSERTQSKLKQVYQPARVSYAKLNGGNAVQTVATDAVLVSREYRTEKYVNGLASLRSCFYKTLDELKETTGTHPKWQAVNPENKGKWSWYTLPDVSNKRK